MMSQLLKDRARRAVKLALFETAIVFAIVGVLVLWFGIYETAEAEPRISAAVHFFDLQLTMML
jgi:hypothetical protein